MPDLSKTRAAALLAVLALGAGGGFLAGCGGDSENTSDDTVPTAVTTAEDGGAVTVPGETNGETVAPDDVQTLPSQTTGTNGGTGGTPSGSSTTKGSSTTSSTVPGGSPSSAPQDTGGSAAPEDGGGTSTSGGGSGSSGSGSGSSGSSGGSNADQDPDCKPGTGPGQPLPQCEPVSGEDAQDNEG